MNGFWGLLIIILLHVLFILFGGISNTEYFNALMLPVYFVLLALCIYAVILLNKVVYSIKILVSWILISITPAAFFSINFYLTRYKDDWFWAYTWTYVIPFFLAIIQIIYIVFLLDHKRKTVIKAR